MAERLYYYVLTVGGRWEVRVQGHPNGSFMFDRKEDALNGARAGAKENWEKNGKPSGVRVQLQNGQWEEERTFGNDPFPPRG